MANSVDPDRTAPFKEQSDQGLHCLLRNVCPNIKSHSGSLWLVKYIPLINAQS